MPALFSSAVLLATANSVAAQVCKKVFALVGLLATSRCSASQKLRPLFELVAEDVSGEFTAELRER
ncbi:MAG: hypothetical protein ACOH2I_16115 [Pseudomonas sp.]